MSDYVTELASILGSHVWYGPLLLWPLLGACAGFLGTLLLCWSRSRRAPGPDVHWSVRARWAQECRAAATHAGLVAVMTVGFVSFNATHPLGLLASALSVSSMAAAAAGAQFAFRRLLPSLFKATTSRERLADLAFGPGTFYYWALAPFVWLPFVTSAFDTQTGMVLSLAFTMHFAWGVAALQLWRAFGLITSPAPEVEALVRETAEHTRTPLRHVWVWRWTSPNAFAFPASNDIALTSRLIHILTPEELSAVVLHELAHLREPRRMLVLRLGLSLLPLSLLLLRPVFVAHGFLGVLALLCGLVVVWFAGMWLTQRAEHTADAGAHGEDASPAYASALEKLHEDRLLPAVIGGRGPKSHPDLYDRMIAAGVTPDFPRPLPPETGRGIPYFVGLVVFFALVAFAAGTASAFMRHTENLSAATWLVTPSADDLLQLELRSDDEQTRALVALGLQGSVDPDAWFDHAWEMHLVRDCEGVAALADRAEVVGAHDEQFMTLSFTLRSLVNECWE